MSFRVGQRLVCVNAIGWVSHSGTGDRWAGPANGETVTCAGYHPHSRHHIYLVEYTDPTAFGKRAAFDVSEFRPIDELQDRLTEIERECSTIEEPELV